MATVFELSEPYRNHLIPVLPPGPGVCAVCWTAVGPDFRLCFQCNAARNKFRRLLADIVVPVALAVKREQFAYELWHYKYDLDASVRARLTTRLAAALWRFLGEHEEHIAEATDVPEFEIVTTVPGTREREGEHPLERIAGTIVGQTKGRFEPLLTRGQDAGASPHTLAVGRYRATRALRDPAVLLIDDTWTTGGNAQSAVLALRAAGAARVAVVVIGRHFDRGFRDCEAYYQQARARKFTWDTCCLEPARGADSAGRRGNGTS